MHAKRAGIYVKRQRYKCRECNETFFEDLPDIDKAYQLYQSWLSEIPKELMSYFEPLIKSMTNWKEEIFNYFNVPITNAYTESLNNLIKVMNKVGRGYSFEALRAKILFTKNNPLPLP